MSKQITPMKKIWDIRRLRERGVKPKDIAKRLNVSLSVVYTYSRSSNNRGA